MSKTLKMSILLVIITLGFLFLGTEVKAVEINSKDALFQALDTQSATIIDTTIKLTGDIETDIVDFCEYDWVLDLNGYTLTAMEFYVNDGSLIINDSKGNGKLFAGYTMICEGAKTEINNGIFSNNLNLIDNSGELIINNGTFNSIWNFGTLTINDGNFANVLCDEGILNINGGTFTSYKFKEEVDGEILDNDYFSMFNIKNASITINGGTFKANGINEALRIYGKNEYDVNESSINDIMGKGYLAEYKLNEENCTSWEVSYSSVKVVKDKYEEILNKIAPNGVWTVNSYRPTEHIEGMTVLTATLKETFEKEGIDYSELDLYGCFDESPEDGIIEIVNRITGTRKSRQVKVVYDEPGKVLDKEPIKIINDFLAKNDKLNIEFDDLNEKTAYRVEDLYLINYFYNVKKGVDNSLALNFSKELIEDANGSNIYFRFYGGFGGGDSTQLYSFEGGQGAVFHDGTIYASINSGVTLSHVLYIPEDTADSTSAYINAAMKRIKDYLGATARIKIEVGDTFDSLNEDESYWNSNGFIDETTCGSYYYNITINERTYRFAICKKDSNQLENPKYIGSDIKSNISITSNSTEIPLDTAINAEKVTRSNIEKALGTSVYEAYDISLYSNAKQEYIKKLDNGKFIVNISVPEILKDKNITVYYINSEGETTEHTVTVKDGMATFETNHFSTYALAEKITEIPKEDIKGEKDDTPKTGVENTIVYIIVTTILAGVGAVSLRGKN